jgi:hypothetical protein
MASSCLLELVDRAAAASRRGLPPRGERKRLAARATGKRARDEAAAPIRSWQDGLSVRGTARPEVTDPVSVECGTHKDRPGAKPQAARARSPRARHLTRSDGRRTAALGGPVKHVISCWHSTLLLRAVDDSSRLLAIAALLH